VFVSNEHLKLLLSMFVFGSFLAQNRTKLVELGIKLAATRRRIQQGHIQLLILKIEHTMSGFQIFLNTGDIIIRDLQGYMQLGMN
jgi:hypothetical protein